MTHRTHAPPEAAILFGVPNENALTAEIGRAELAGRTIGQVADGEAPTTDVLKIAWWFRNDIPAVTTREFQHADKAAGDEVVTRTTPESERWTSEELDILLELDVEMALRLVPRLVGYLAHVAQASPDRRRAIANQLADLGAIVNHEYGVVLDLGAQTAEDIR